MTQFERRVSVALKDAYYTWRWEVRGVPLFDYLARRVVAAIEATSKARDGGGNVVAPGSVLWEAFALNALEHETPE